MSMRSRWALWALLLSGSAWSQVQPLDELARMDRALGSVGFSGVLVFSRDGQLDALRIRRGAAAEESIERLTGPSLPLQRDRAGAWFAQGPRFSPSGNAAAGAAPDRNQAYELHFVTEDRVAGRVAHVIDARARDSFRYGRRYWIDRDTGVALRAAVYGADGILVEQWMFTSFEPGAESLPVAPAPSGAVDFAAASPDTAGATRMQIVDPPQGFALLSAAIAASGEQLVFSDGLARVSVFVEPVPQGAAVLSGLQQRGALSVFGRIFEGLQVVVVGEVPPATAERFAQSVARRDAG